MIVPVHYSGLRPDRLSQSPVIVTMSDNSSAHGHRHANIIASDPKPLTASKHGRLRRHTSVFSGSALTFPPHHPPARTAPDRPPGRDNGLRDGAARRIPQALPAHAPLRRLGPGRGRGMDRRTQTSLARSEVQHTCRPGCQATPVPARQVSVLNTIP